MNNTETPGTATIKYKHITNRSNIKYQGWDANGLKEFTAITKLIKSQPCEQYRQQKEENNKNQLNRMYGIITSTPSESADLYTAYNDLSSEEDAPVSTEQNQSNISNLNICESDNNQRDMLNDNIENQMDTPMQEIVNDDGELVYKYM